MTPRFFLRSMAAFAVMSMLAAAPQARAESLADALIEAYKNSNLLDQNRAVLRAADEDVAIAVSALRPVINFILQGQFTQSNGLNNENLSGVMQLSADITLFDSGARRFGIDAAKELVLATREALIGVEQNVLLDAVSAYMSVRSRIQFVQLRQRNVQVIQQELRAAQDRFDVGEVTRTDVALAEARLAAARSNLVAAEGDLAVAREEYNAATGNFPGNLTAPPAAPITAKTLDAAKVIAQQNHPAIRQAQHQVSAAELSVARAQAGMRPRVTAGLELSVDDNRSDQSALDLTLSQPIYAGGQLSALYRQARANAEEARAALHQTVVNVVTQVGTAWSQLAVARAQITSSERQITAARIAYEGLREEATLGARTTLDVLDAEQELLDAEVNRVVAINDQYVAVYSLLSAMGLLTVDHLNLGIPTYDASAYYNAVKNAPATSAQGRRLDKVLRSIGRD